MKPLDEVHVTAEAPPATVKPADRGSAGRARESVPLYLSVCAGSIIGSVLRWLSSLVALAWFGPDFPWGTLFVNVVGSFVIGFYATVVGPDGRMFAGTRQRQFVMAGICGGFTTFSAFSLETLRLAQAGNWFAAGLNVGVSIVTWLAAVWLGHTFASRLNRLGGI